MNLQEAKKHSSRNPVVGHVDQKQPLQPDSMGRSGLRRGQIFGDIGQKRVVIQKKKSHHKYYLLRFAQKPFYFFLNRDYFYFFIFFLVLQTFIYLLIFLDTINVHLLKDFKIKKKKIQQLRSLFNSNIMAKHQICVDLVFISRPAAQQL